MQFSIKRDALLKSLTLVQGVIEKKNTLPILSNVLIDAKDNKLIVVAPDLDLIFYCLNLRRSSVNLFFISALTLPVSSSCLGANLATNLFSCIDH